MTDKITEAGDGRSLVQAELLQTARKVHQLPPRRQLGLPGLPQPEKVSHFQLRVHQRDRLNIEIFNEKLQEEQVRKLNWVAEPELVLYIK